MTRTARRIATVAALATAALAPAAPASAFEASWERFHLSSAPERTHLTVKLDNIMVSGLQGTAAGRVLETQALAFAVETDARGNVVQGNFIGADALTAPEQEEAAGMLLPAVQKIREHASRSRSMQAPLFVLSGVAADVDLDGDRIADVTVGSTRAGTEGLSAIAVDRAAFAPGR